VALLREIQRLSQEEGVNLAGIKRIIDLEQFVYDLQQRILDLEADLAAAHQRVLHAEAMSPFPRRDLVPRGEAPQTALVVWRPRGSRSST
jgi:MerR family transcriptional regulator, heat shock protein HspR